MSATTQNRVPSVNMSAPNQNRAPSHLQNPYRAGMLNDFRNSHLQQTLNPRAHQPMQPSNTQWSHVQQGCPSNNQQARVMASSHVARQGNSQAGIVWTAGATVNSQQARVIATAVAARQSQSISSQNQTCVEAPYFKADSFWGLTGEQRGPPVQAVSRTNELFNSQPDQNWRPTSRMRGSLTDRQLTDDIRQRLIMPSSQQVQSSRPQGAQPVRTTSPLDVLIANSRNAHNNPSRP